MGSYGMKTTRLQSKGFTLIASLLLLLLLSGMAIGLMMMVNTEGKVGGTDLQNNYAYHAAEGGMEVMYANLAAAMQNAQVPTAAQICGAGTISNAPSMTGIVWKEFSVMPGNLQQTSCPSTLTGKWGTISTGSNAGLYAQVIPINLLATAAAPGGQEVSMARQAQMALVPVFQFGMFCDSDCTLYPSATMTFQGPIHVNGDFYPFSASSLTFQSKMAVFGNIVRTKFPNTETSTWDGTIYVPTSSASNACSTTTTSCTSMDSISTDYGDGSVTAGGSISAQPSGSISTYWASFSGTTTNHQVINGNYYTTGASTPPGTGATKLSMPFVNGTTFPYELIRRPPTGESSTSTLGSSREYNMAQIRVLLSDDPAEFQNGTGASDPQNVRLANVAQGTGNTVVSQYGVTMPSTSIGSTFGTPSSGNTYNMYFASGSNAVPTSGCSSSSASCSPEWPYAPGTWTSTMASNAGIFYWANVPSNAPYVWSNSTTPTIPLCPPGNASWTVSSSSSPTPSTLCPWSGAYAGQYPYYLLPNSGLPTSGSTLTPYNSANDSSWSLLDGWLRVEYLNNSGAWVPVTNEWLQLGFARGVTVPTANGAGNPSTGTKNPINPNAILLLQQPADRLSTYDNFGALPAEPAATGASAPSSCAAYNTTTWACSTAASAPVCTHSSSGVCTTWNPGVPPLLPSDAGSGGQWAFGVTPTTPTTTTPQSLTEYNWYPINFYDTREGEAREINWTSINGASDNTCTPMGVMNAVEIDVGNLQRWLQSSSGSGPSVNSSLQNGYVLYFSDRRGMLPSKNPVSVHLANTKTGDSGLEDSINSSSVNGVPDGVLETPITGHAGFYPEDNNGNSLLDNWGAYNLGLGFYGTVASPSASVNTTITSTAVPNPYLTLSSGSGNNRIQSCSTTGRKNWVSGARHGLKLVDASLGNLPLNPHPNTYNGTTYYGGFTVASENPVYVQGNYNSKSGDPTFGSTPSDGTGEAAAGVIADTVIGLSNSWDDRVSLSGYPGNSNSPTDKSNRNATDTFYRFAAAAGMARNFTYPTTSWVNLYDLMGVDGGMNNYLHLLETWGSSVNEWYKGSFASMFFSTYNTGFYKTAIAHGAPTRHFYFDADFQSPFGLPPGTPMFKDVESLGYRQVLAVRGLNGN